MPAGRDARLALAIAAGCGLGPLEVRPVLGQGSVNHVFVVHTPAERYVVRFAQDPLRPDGYQTEAWCLQQAAAHGVPSPAVVAAGTLDGVTYLVESFVDGAPGATGGLGAWRTLGAYARRIHAIPLPPEAPEGLYSRFGRDLPAAWRAHLDYNLAALNAADPLLELGVYPAEQQAALREVVARLQSAELTFGLSHGDLTPANLLLPAGPPVLIDWDTASAGPVPDADLLSLLRMHQLDGRMDETVLHAFADGCGVDLGSVLPRLADELVLGHLDLVRWARDRRPDLLAETVVASRAGVRRNLDADGRRS